jgi:hypothetical protein
MRHRLPLVLSALGFVGASFAAESGFEFSGVLGGGKDLRVALTSKASGVTQWISVGGSVAGYTISEYDGKADVLVLTKDGQQLRLPLKQRKAAKADATLSPEVERAILNNLRQLAAAADQYYLENGKRSTSYDELVGPTKYVIAINPVNGENYRSLQFVQGQAFVVTTSTGHSVSYQP